MTIKPPNAYNREAGPPSFCVVENCVVRAFILVVSSGCPESVKLYLQLGFDSILARHSSKRAGLENCYSIVRIQ